MSEINHGLDLERLPVLSTGQVPLLQEKDNFIFALVLADRKIVQEFLDEEATKTKLNHEKENPSELLSRLFDEKNTGSLFSWIGYSKKEIDQEHYIDGLVLGIPRNSLVSKLTDEDMFKCFQLLNEGISTLRIQLIQMLEDYGENATIFLQRHRYKLSKELIKALDSGHLRIELGNQQLIDDVDPDNPFIQMLVSKNILSDEFSDEYRTSTFPKNYKVTKMR